MGKKNKKDNKIFSEQELVDQDICPDCWNEMAYYNEYMTFIEDRTKADIHGPKDQKKAFIEEFVQDNITGIRLKNDHNRHYCPSCEKDFLYKPGEVKNQDEADSEKSQ